MAYLIDGNNFIGHISPYNIKDPRNKFHLVSKLLIFQRIKKTRIFLVFDGAPDQNLTGENFQKKNFNITFPHFNQNADGVIKEIISKQTDLRRFFVVSSDREIKRYAKEKGAKSLGCKEFNHELKAILKEHKKSLEAEKKVSPPSPLEISHWQKIFKNKK